MVDTNIAVCHFLVLTSCSWKKDMTKPKHYRPPVNTSYHSRERWSKENANCSHHFYVSIWAIFLWVFIGKLHIILITSVRELGLSLCVWYSIIKRIRDISFYWLEFLYCYILVSGTSHSLLIFQGKRKEGNVAKYTTRNKALNRLQIKLPEFRCVVSNIILHTFEQIGTPYFMFCRMNINCHHILM